MKNINGAISDKIITSVRRLYPANQISIENFVKAPKVDAFMQGIFRSMRIFNNEIQRTQFVPHCFYFSSIFNDKTLKSLNYYGKERRKKSI